MIYRVGVINRRPGLTADGYTRHWREVHGGLASKLPGLRSYRQNHIRDRLYEASPSPLQSVDGLSQLRFASIAAMETAERSPEYAACKEDIPKFQGAITILVVEREDLIGPPLFGETPLPDGTAKLLWVSRSREGRGADGRTDRSAWLRRHAAELPAVVAAAQSTVVDKDHPVAAGVPQGEPAADALTEVWFADAGGLSRAVQSDAGRRLLHEDPHHEPIVAYAIEEVIIV